MEKEELIPILENQRKFFASGKTLDINYRLGNLKKLRSLILRYEDELKIALQKDFHKPGFKVLGTESRFSLAELNLMIRHLKRWSHVGNVQYFKDDFIPFTLQGNLVSDFLIY